MIRIYGRAEMCDDGLRWRRRRVDNPFFCFVGQYGVDNDKTDLDALIRKTFPYAVLCETEDEEEKCRLLI